MNYKKIIKSLFIYSAIGCLSAIYPQQIDQISWEDSVYFDTAFLSDFEGVRTAMLSDGFKDVSIKTDDGLSLRGLFLERPEAIYTMIVCCGFYPGRKEGMATLFKLMPADCNLLFFDARGHGKSEGRFLTALHTYGKNEYRDVLGAIAFIRQRSEKPIILYGICAGTYHATRALAHLQQYSSLDAYAIKALIFDSGFNSIMSASTIPKKHLEEKIVPGIFTSYVYSSETKKTIKSRLGYRITWGVLSLCLSGVEWCVTKAMRSQMDDVLLTSFIPDLKLPIFFIHAKNDLYTPFSDILSVASQATSPTTWWIEDSEHAVNHLKHKRAYREQLCSFIGKALKS